MTTDKDDHRQLDEILARSYESLRDQVPGQREAVLGRFLELRSIEPPRRGRRELQAVLVALAACLLAAVTVRILTVASSPGTAYGLEALPQQLRDVQTIRLKGTQFVYDMSQPDAAPTKVPFEYLLKRPDKYRMTFMNTYQGKGRLRIEQGSTFCDGRSGSFRNDTKKQYATGPILSALSARVSTEDFAQMFILYTLLGRLEAPFHKIGEEKIGGKWCHLYEGRFEDPVQSTIEKLWFDPTQGYPVRIVRDAVQDDGTTRRDEEINEIAVNVPLADELFRFTPPEGYELLPRTDDVSDPKLALSPYPRGSGSAGATKLEAWYSWQLSERAALIVWRRSAPAAAADGTLDWRSNMEIKLAEPEDQQQVRHGWIHRSGKSDAWNWSVVVIAGGKRPSRVVFNLELHGAGGMTAQHLLALRFPDQELEEILVESGRSTLPADVQTPSLAQLRVRASQLLTLNRSE